MDEPWTAEIERIYNSIHEITPHDASTLEAADFSEEQLREEFEKGFLTRSDDSDISPEDRRSARIEFMEWMSYLGYDTKEFDWDAWKQWMGYSDQ